MEEIRKYFERTAKLSDADWISFSSRLVRQEFPRKSLLLKAGKIENYLSFIETGITRLCIPKEEDDLTFGFAFAGSFVSGYDSFLTQTASIYNIETLTDTVLWRMSYQNLQVIYKETEVGNTIGRHASEQLFLEKTKREISLLNETAEQRYLNLLAQQPRLFQEIPLKYLASYIGITPQALSRIRKRIS